MKIRAQGRERSCGDVGMVEVIGSRVADENISEGAGPGDGAEANGKEPSTNWTWRDVYILPDCLSRQR